MVHDSLPSLEEIVTLVEKGGEDLVRQEIEKWRTRLHAPSIVVTSPSTLTNQYAPARTSSPGTTPCHKANADNLRSSTFNVVSSTSPTLPLALPFDFILVDETKSGIVRDERDAQGAEST
jgi:hypothetical protein